VREHRQRDRPGSHFGECPREVVAAECVEATPSYESRNSLSPAAAGNTRSPALRPLSQNGARGTAEAHTDRHVRRTLSGVRAGPAHGGDARDGSTRARQTAV
jgi:hypothetical protein